MSKLEQMQHAMMAALDQGPDYLPDTLFAGARADWVRGMKVHANTISFARLVALEDSFPKTREAMGGDAFNALSRHYLDHPGVTALPLNSIGLYFAEFLTSRQIDHALVDLVRAEWAWLQSFHGAEATPLSLTDFAGLAENVISETAIALHPTVRVVTLRAPPHALLLADVPSLSEASGLLTVRPYEHVLLSPLGALHMAAIAFMTKPTRLCNLFAFLTEQDDEPAALPIAIDLISAGVLIRNEQEEAS